jgi:hypothetical protein
MSVLLSRSPGKSLGTHGQPPVNQHKRRTLLAANERTRWLSRLGESDCISRRSSDTTLYSGSNACSKYNTSLSKEELAVDIYVTI